MYFEGVRVASSLVQVVLVEMPDRCDGQERDSVTSTVEVVLICFPSVKEPTRARKRVLGDLHRSERPRARRTMNSPFPLREHLTDTARW